MEPMKLKIRTQPLGGDGKLRGLAMVTFGSALTIYPIRIMEGQNGLFIVMPQRQEPDRWKDVVYPKTAELRRYLNEAILKTFSATENKERIIQGVVHPEISALVVPVTKEGSNLAAMASITVHGVLKIDSISVYRQKDGSLKPYYPQRHWQTEKGERMHADIILPTDSYKQQIAIAIQNAYDIAVKQNPQQKQNKNQFHNFDERNYSEKEMEDMELALRGYRKDKQGNVQKRFRGPEQADPEMRQNEQDFVSEPEADVMLPTMQ